MSEQFADGKKTAAANAEILGGIADLQNAFTRILGGIAQQRGAVAIGPLNEFRDKVEANTNEAQASLQQLTADLHNVTVFGSEICQRLITLDERLAEDVWGADPGKWREQDLPSVPPGTDIPDVPPTQ